MAVSTRRLELSHGISLHLREAGEGAPTLLVHGWAVPGTVWDPVVARWPAEAGKLVVPDLRGTGWSDKPREGYSLDDDVSDLVALIDALELDNLALVGHSKGGAIAQRVALERPKALRKLILISPVPAGGVALDDQTIGFFQSLCGHREGAAQLIGMMLAKQPKPELLDALVESMASVCIESLLGGFEAWRTANFADRIAAIETPTLVLSGGAEEVLSPTLMQTEVADRIPSASVQLIDGAGHYPQIECPDELVEALTAAL